jgi:hypothetical protein
MGLKKGHYQRQVQQLEIILSYPKSCIRWRWNLKGLLLERGWIKSAKNLGTSTFNPKPHGSGPICPHFFQRPITQNLKCRKSAKNTYSTENIC